MEVVGGWIDGADSCEYREIASIHTLGFVHCFEVCAEGASDFGRKGSRQGMNVSDKRLGDGQWRRWVEG